MSKLVIKNIGHMVTMDATRRELAGVDMALENGVILPLGITCQGQALMRLDVL